MRVKKGNLESELKKEPDIILILDKTSIDRLEYEENGPNLINAKELLVIPFTRGSKQSFLQSLEERGLMQRSAVLVKDPYDCMEYDEITQAPFNFAIKKSLYFSFFCHLLGAKDVRVINIDTVKKKVETSVQLLGKVKSFGAEGKTETEKIDKFKRSLHLHDVFSSSQPNIEEAEAFLHRHRLEGDINMTSLFQIIRQSGKGMVSREIILNVSSEAQRAIQMVGKLKLPSFVVESLGPEYQQTINEIIEFDLTI